MSLRCSLLNSLFWSFQTKNDNVTQCLSQRAMILSICCIGDTLPIRQLWSVFPFTVVPLLRERLDLSLTSCTEVMGSANHGCTADPHLPATTDLTKSNHPTQLQPSFHPRNLALRLCVLLELKHNL